MIKVHELRFSRETSYKAVMFSKHLNKYYVTTPCAVDGGCTSLANLFGFENYGVDVMMDDIFTSEDFLTKFNCDDEEYFKMDWVHIDNIQSIGIRDKKGDEIYEGHIFQDGGMVVYFAPRYIKLFPTKDENGLDHWEDIDGDCDVIAGNVFENPELWEVDHE